MSHLWSADSAVTQYQLIQSIHTMMAYPFKQCPRPIHLHPHVCRLTHHKPSAHSIIAAWADSTLQYSLTGRSADPTINMYWPMQYIHSQLGRFSFIVISPSGWPTQSLHILGPSDIFLCPWPTPFNHLLGRPNSNDTSVGRPGHKEQLTHSIHT